MDVPGYYGIGDSYEEARDEIREGLPWTAGEDLILVHVIPSDDGSESPTCGATVSMEKTCEYQSPYYATLGDYATQVAV